nr:membrane protein insertion efficiency factor YidD [Roseimaritima ulvae]
MLRAMAIFAIRCYQVGISPWIGPCCRFSPTCSQYAIEAIGRYGFFRGGLKTVWRIARCHPWNPGGYDPP